MILIRSTNSNGFRLGQWAKIVDFMWINNRICYVVEFIDGKKDTWVVYDPSDPYEFATA